MKAEDYLTQEMVDKLQNDVDDNNGIINWNDLEPLLDGFKKQLLIPKDRLIMLLLAEVRTFWKMEMTSYMNEEHTKELINLIEEWEKENAK